jgi:hypothetical protein
VRKLWYAGAAVASGMILFAASPARADEQPTSPQLLPGNSVAPPFGDLLSGTGGYALSTVRDATTTGTGAEAINSVRSAAAPALHGANDGVNYVERPTNNLHVTVPLDGSKPLARVQSGQNPSALSRSTEGLPAADVIGPLTQSDGTDDLFGGNVFDQFPVLGGLMPNGQQQQFDPTFDPSLDRPTVGQTESLPLLGGLLPGPGTPDVPSVSGLPGGGLAVLAPATGATPAEDPTAAPTSSTPALSTPTPSAPTPSTTKSASKDKAKPGAGAAPVDPRLHEEPIDPSERTFSPDGRPVAGVDQQYK